MPIIKALTMGWSEPKLVLGTVFAFWTLPQIFFYGMYAIIGIGLIIFYILSFGAYTRGPGQEQLNDWSTTQTVVLAGGHTLGIIFQAVVLLWPLKRLGLNLKPKFGWKGMGLRHTGQLAGF